jgi:hypothetical protein
VLSALAVVLAACTGASGGDASPGRTAPDGLARPGATGTPAPASTRQLRTTTTALLATVPTTTSTPPTSALAPGGPIDCALVPARNELARSRPRYDVELVIGSSAGAGARPDTGAVAGPLGGPLDGLVTGRVTVAFTPDLAVDELVFRLWANAPRSQADGPGLTVTSVETSVGVTAVEQPDPTVLGVRLGAVVGPGETVQATVAWSQVLPWRAEDRVAVGEDWARLGSVVPLLAWEPGVGWSRGPATAGFAEATSSPAADWSLTVQAPEGYEVLASGVPVGPAWVAVGARDVAISVGRFQRATAVVEAPQPVEVTVAVALGVAEEPGTYLALVSEALVSFGSRFGPYPFPAYSLTITPDLGGGIEYPGHVMQGPGTGGRTTTHEVAHQWFYGLVGNDQGRDPVLDEGLASYAELTHLGISLDPVEWPLPEVAAGRAGEPMAYWDGHLDSYYEGVYVQGALALAALGPVDVVDCGLRQYVAEQAWEIATPADLVATLARLVPGAPAVLASYGIT